MKPSFTPGPWSAMPANDKGRVYIDSDEDNFTVAAVDAVKTVRDRGEAEANAQLIAAAPDLFSALETAIQILALLNAPGTNDPIEAAVYKGKAALKRASAQS